MGAFEKCPDCGGMVRALHSGGDANIPEPGVCDDCHGVRAAVALDQRTRSRAAAVKAGIAAAAKGA